MLTTCLLALLALSSTCHGAALVKREAIAGDLDRSFDLFGAHIGLKYKNPSDRMKGGQLRVAVEDMKAIFPMARSKSIDVTVKFDGGDSKTDGLFDLDIDYHLVHPNDHGVEEGTLKMFRHKEGNNWVSHLKTVATPAPHGTRSIIPSMINNAQIDMVSDRQTKFNLKYLNKYKNRERRPARD